MMSQDDIVIESVIFYYCLNISSDGEIIEFPKFNEKFQIVMK